MKKVKVLKESPIEYELHYNQRMDRFGSFIIAGLMTLSLMAPSVRKGNKKVNSEDLKDEEMLTLSLPIEKIVKTRNDALNEETEEVTEEVEEPNVLEEGNPPFGIPQKFLYSPVLFDSNRPILEVPEREESVDDEPTELSLDEEPIEEINEQPTEVEEPTEDNAPVSAPVIPISSVPLEFNQDLSISNDEKIAWILQHWNLTYDEFMIVIATCCHEGGPNYVEGYAVINNVFNRVNSYEWSPREDQRNLYYQIVRSGQYTSYLHGHYKEYLNATPETVPAFQAMIDFLYQEKPTVLHNYLGFRSHGSNKFTSNGNDYRDPQSDDDYISTDLNHITVEQLREIAAVGGFANYFTQAEVIEEPVEELVPEENPDTTIDEDTIDTPEEVTPEENPDMTEPSEEIEPDLETPLMDSYPELSYPRRVRVKVRS